MDNLKISAIRESEDQKRLTIQSNFLQGRIEGDYSYRTLPASVLNIMRRYIPALILPDKKPIETENNFHFDMHIYNTELLSTVFQIPVKVYTHSTIKGYFNDKAQRLRVEAIFPVSAMKTNSSNPECSFARIPVTSSIHAYASATANQAALSI